MYHKNGLVLTQTGLKFCNEICVGESVYSVDGFVPVKQIIKSDRQLFKIENDYLNYSFFTEEQKFMTRNCDNIETKTLKDFKFGDIISIIPGSGYSFDNFPIVNYGYSKLTSGNRSNRLNENVNIPEELDEPLAYFLGYLYGDGHVIHKQENFAGVSLACSNDYPNIKTKLIDIIKRSFNLETKVYAGDGDLETLDFYSRIVIENLHKNEILKQKAGNLIFPEKILKSPTSVQFAFISGLFDADGCVQRSKKSYRITIIDLEFLKIIQKILLANGIVSRMSVEPRGTKGWSDLGRLALVGKESIVRFCSLCEYSDKINATPVVNKTDHVTTIYIAKDLGVKYYLFSYINNQNLISYSNFYKLSEESPGFDKSRIPLLRSFVDSITKENFDECYGFVTDSSGIFVDGFLACS